MLYDKPFQSIDEQILLLTGQGLDTMYELACIDKADNTLRNLLFAYLTDFEQKLKASIAHHFSEKYSLDHKKYISNNNFKMDQKNNRKTQNLINQISRKGVYDVSNE